MDDSASTVTRSRPESHSLDEIDEPGVVRPVLTGRDTPSSDEAASRSPWAERLTEFRHRVGLDSRALAWVVAALAAGLVALWLLRPSPTPVGETIPMASAPGRGAGDAGGTVAGPSSSPSTASEVVAHAAGAVARPGVYTLGPGARVDDLIRAAGGVARDADIGRVNLAAPLTDGARVYVPHIGELELPQVGPDGGSTPPGEPDGESPVPVNINTASVDELDELPGVGPSIAAAIVAYRTEHSGFSSVDELLEVRGIGEAKLAEIRDLVTL